MRKHLFSVLLWSLLAAAAHAGSTQTASSYSDLQTAVTQGGVWTVNANIVWTGLSLAVNSTVNTTLTLVSDPVTCGGMCVLDASQLGGHFVVLPGNTLVLTNLVVVNSNRGVYGTEPCIGGTTNVLINSTWTHRTWNPAFDACSSYSYFSDSTSTAGTGVMDCSRYMCGAVIVGEDASLQVAGCVFANNTGTTTGAYQARGGAISIIASSTGGFSITNTTFINNAAALPNGFNYASGGAISVDEPWEMWTLASGPMTILNCSFIGNSANNGGAIDATMSWGTLTISGSTFMGNLVNGIPYSGTGTGGALHLGARVGDRPFLGVPKIHSTSSSDVKWANPELNQHAHYVVSGCSFVANKAVVRAVGSTSSLNTRGGAIYIDTGAYGFTVISSTFVNNSANQGGAIYQNGMSITNVPVVTQLNPAVGAVADGTNQRYSPGGFTFNDYWAYAPSFDYSSLAPVGWASTYMLTLMNCTFTGNSVTPSQASSRNGRGGALYISCGLTYAVSTSFVNNAAVSLSGYNSFGGAVLLTDECMSTIDTITYLGSNFTCVDCLFDSNIAANAGAAIAVMSPNTLPAPKQPKAMVLSLSGGIIRNHTSAALGGAVYIMGADTNATLTSVSLTGNSAGVGGAVYAGGNVTFTSCMLSGNSAVNGSALVVPVGANVTVASTNMSGNNAALFGTTFVAAGAAPSLNLTRSSVFTANIAQAGGVVFYDLLTTTTGAASSTISTTQITSNYGSVIASVPIAAKFVVGNMTATSPGNIVSAPVRSGSTISFSFTLADAFHQTPSFWKDAVLDLACTTFASGNGSSSVSGCPSGALLGSLHTSYFTSSASLAPLAYGNIGSSVIVTATLQSPTVPILLPPGLQYSINISFLPCASTEVFDTLSQLCRCMAGTFLNSTSATCIFCPTGTFSAVGATSCTLCQAGSFSDAGFTRCTPCPAGTYLAGNGTCLLCAAGQYSPSASATSCQVNPTGSYSTANRTSYVLCPAGTYLNSVTQNCSACALGTFASSNGSAVCTTNTPGYYSSADCKSQIACPAGTFLNGTSLMCSNCQPGTFTNLPGQTTCQVNPTGQVSTPQTTLSSSLQLGGVTAASFGASQNATLTAAIAASLNVSASSVAITAVVDTAPAGRRHLAAGGQVTANFTVTCVGTATTTAATANLNATASFSSALARSLSASTDPVLSAVGAASISVSAPQASTLYLASQPCPAGTFLNGATQNCYACAVGTVAPSTGATTCTVCPARTVWINATVPCAPCPNNAVTSPNNAAQCACAPGFYDTLFGSSMASPVCAVCPLGGICNVGFIAADEGYWRESTVSALLYKCRVGNCLAESVVGPLTAFNGNSSAAAILSPVLNTSQPTNCVPGNTGPLCSLCLPGYAVQSGACLPCDAGSAYADWSIGEKAALIAPLVSFGMVVIVFAFFQPLSPRLESTATNLTDSALATARGVKDRIVSCVTCCFKSRSAEKAKNAPPPNTSADAEKTAVEGASTTAVEAPVGNADARKAAASAALTGVGASAAQAALGVGAAMRVGSFFSGDEAADGDGDDDDVGSGSGSEDSFYGETGAALELYYMMQRLVEKAQKYGKIMINFYQIVSTFIRSLDIPWPHVFITTMGKVNIVNLNLVHLPKAACMSPKTSYYAEFQGYTLGLLCALIFIAVFWAAGVYVLAPLSLATMTAEEVQARKAKFSSTCLQRTLMLLYLVYPGVSVAIFGMFSCTKVGSVWYLDQDFTTQCYTRTWWRYVAGAIVWLFLVPFGVPVFFNRLLRHFRVPDMAQLLEDNAWLREAAEHTWRLGMPQPGGLDVQTLCCDTIDDNHLAMIHGVLVKRCDADEAADLLAGRVNLGEAVVPGKKDVEGDGASSHPAPGPMRRISNLRARISETLRPDLAARRSSTTVPESMGREEQLAELLSWCRNAVVLSIAPISWTSDLGVPEAPANGASGDGAKHEHTHRTGLRSCQVPSLLSRASVECGFLFAVYTTKCWYWESVELIRKLILTSILALISPGSAGQVVVGILVAFVALIGNIKLKPFSEPSLNLVNQIAQVNLFCFLFVALLLKVNLDGDGSARFFTGIVGAMTLLPVLLPVGLQAYIKLGGFSSEESHDLKDAADRGM